MKLIIDIVKAGKLNTGKLVKRPVQVRGKDGKVHTRMQWVKPGEDPKVERTSSHQVEDTSMRRVPQFDNPYSKIAKELEESRKVQSGTEDADVKEQVNNWSKKFAKNPKELYQMMKNLGIVDSDVDPRTLPELSQKDGNGMGPIIHMKALMAFKKKMRENPELMDELDSKFPVADAPAKAKVSVKDKPVSKAQQGGNTIKGILDKMSREEKYELMAKLNISTIDPANIKEWSKEEGDGTAPIRHMKNMMALKKAVELDPSLLNLDFAGDVTVEEKKRVEHRDDEEKNSDTVHEFLNSATKELKLSWAKKFEDHDIMKNRTTSEHSNIDNMHKFTALKKILKQDPSLMESDLKGELETEQLRNLKITNKQMQKVLIHAVGLKGIKDVSIAEKGVEWEFGESSFARIDEEDGKIILSIVDTGKSGEEWNEISYPMEKVRDYLNSLKEGTGSAERIAPVETPLHRKSPKEILEALKNDFDANYTDKVGEALRPHIHDAWKASSHTESLYNLATAMGSDFDTVKKILKANGVQAGHQGMLHKFKVKSDEWNKLVFSHMIDTTKTKNANDYIKKWNNVAGGSMNSTWLLHESAKNWTPEERSIARKEIIADNVEISSPTLGFFGSRDVIPKITEHLHKSLEFVPFDLMTDVIASGCKFNFKEYDANGEKLQGDYYTKEMNEIFFDSGYITHKDSLNASHPMEHKPENLDSETGGTYDLHPFSDTASHEFAHAIDYYLGGLKQFSKWTNKKYSGSDPQVVLTSYNNTVERSNPNRELGHDMNGSVEYVYHKDEWMSTYEGRVYDPTYYNDNTMDNVMNVDNGKVLDTGWSSSDYMRGVEHWSENSSRYANAHHMYKRWQEESGDTSTNMKDWSAKMYDRFMKRGYGDDSNNGEKHIGQNGAKYLKSYKRNSHKGRNENPIEAYGYMYHKMSEAHPEMHKAVNEIYGRPDFVSDTTSKNLTESYESQDYARKSETMDLFINI